MDEIDDLRIPQFLRDAAIAKRLTPEQLHALVRPGDRPRDWVMPDMSKYREPRAPEFRIEELDMAKLNEYVESPQAPIEVWKYDASGEPKLLRTFQDLATLETWFMPKYHRSLGMTSSPTISAVLMEISGAPPRAASPARPAPERRVRDTQGAATVASDGATPTREAAPRDGDTPPRPSGAPRKGGYVDKRHLAQLADAGFEKTTDGPPITFRKGDWIVAIAPPPEGKTWSSAWTLLRSGKPENAKTGRGISALLAALDK